MKITIDIDCTPEEARALMGLPNVAPLNDAMTAQIKERMEDYFRSMDPETVMKTWFPAGLQGFEAMRETFWSQFAKGASKPKSGKG
ncbi:MAG: DUF6489 family protein [Alphaproteobacteria bacterium]|nr:DUF6489 family protein [Alphaproteobacteria bacterium]